MDKGKIPQIGYSVEEAANGGWVLVSAGTSDYAARRILGAFDNHNSLLSFLVSEHDSYAKAKRNGTEPAPGTEA